MPKSAAPPDPAKMSFEAATAEIEAIVEHIEDGSLGLEEALAARKRGEALIARVRGILDAAEKELETVTPEDLPSPADDDETTDGDGLPF